MHPYLTLSLLRKLFSGEQPQRVDHFVKNLSCIPTKPMDVNLGWRWCPNHTGEEKNPKEEYYFLDQQ